MVAASRMAGQRYIVNAIIDAEKKVVHAVAGDAVMAHEAGCAFLANYCQVTPERRADIAIATNGGYPLDQNMYQSVKGMTAAEAAAKDDGILIMVSNCGDGHGGEGFYTALRDCESPAALMEEILKVPQDETKPDQWEYQIQARILMKHKVIYVMCGSHEMLVETDKLRHFVNGRMCAGGVFSPHRQVTGSSAFDYKQIFVSCYTLSGIKMCIFWA